VDNISLILHVSAAVLFIGPQVILFLAVIPATLLIKDERLRRDVTMVVTQRFGKIAGFALVLLLVTGLYQFTSVTPEAVTENMNSYRYGWLFMTKMLLFSAVVVLVAMHVVVGRRVGRLTEAVISSQGDEFELEHARQRSFQLSAVMLLVSFAILAFGVMLGRGVEFSYLSS
jgi:uncharacterized membrane protein